jgi:GGDEF domain-containing protein
MSDMVDGPYRLHLQPADGIGSRPRNDPRPGDDALRSGKEQAGRDRALFERDEADLACMFGIPPAEMTPGVRAAIDRLLARLDALARQVEAERDREAYLQELADGHAVLPVGNRRYLIRELSRILERGKAAQSINTFVLISIVNGWKVRYEQGEAAAHGLLCHAAEALIAAVRSSDVVASLGGYDFGVVLTLAGGEAARAKAKALVAAVAAEAADGDGLTLGAEAVWGMHEMRAADAADAVIAAADRDLVARGMRERR